MGVSFATHDPSAFFGMPPTLPPALGAPFVLGFLGKMSEASSALCAFPGGPFGLGFIGGSGVRSGLAPWLTAVFSGTPRRVPDLRAAARCAASASNLRIAFATGESRTSSGAGAASLEPALRR